MRSTRLVLAIVFIFYSSVADAVDATIYKYKMYCQTEAKNVYTWSETVPTTCPNDTAHTINASSVSVVDERGPDSVTIKEETIATGGHYKAETQTINIAAGPDVDTLITHSWPFPVSVLAINFTTSSAHEDDLISVYAPHNSIVGAITADVSPTDTGISVSQTVIDNIAVGFYVTLFDGVTTNELGRVIAVDNVNNELTIETAATDSFAATTPTYVMMSVCQFKDFELGLPWRYEVGLSKIGGSYLPANVQAKMIYTNKSGAAKKLVIDFEYLY